MAQEHCIVPSIFVIDTCYIDELFKVPNYSQHSKEISEKFATAIRNNSRFYVPLPCIFEVANHIAHAKDGNIRAALSRKLLATIKSCIKNQRPWILTPSTGLEVLPELCRVFSEKYVIKGIGLTDTFIIQEAKRLKQEKSHFKVHIWTKDRSLKAYEPDAEENPFIGYKKRAK